MTVEDRIFEAREHLGVLSCFQMHVFVQGWNLPFLATASKANKFVPWCMKCRSLKAPRPARHLPNTISGLLVSYQSGVLESWRRLEAKELT